jgi:hypothetical protein
LNFFGYQGPKLLNIRIVLGAGLDIGVTDFVSRHLLLAAIKAFGHGIDSVCDKEIYE